jgi:hypothetical protein
VLRDAWRSGAVLPRSAVRLPFAISSGLSTLSYWWLKFQGEQDTRQFIRCESFNPRVSKRKFEINQ